MISDQLVWEANKHCGVVTTNLAYHVVLKQRCDPEHLWWHTALWKVKNPSKIKYFILLCLNHKILTWDSLQRRGFFGHGRCVLCHKALETVEHIFGDYVF